MAVGAARLRPCVSFQPGGVGVLNTLNQHRRTFISLFPFSSFRGADVL